MKLRTTVPSSSCRPFVLAASIGVLFASASIVQAQLQWDPAQTPATPGGGSGIWDNVSLFWSNGATDVAWDSQLAIFGGAAGTVTISQAPSGVSATGLTFNTSGYIINSATAADLLTLTGAPVITVNGAATDVATINSIIAGTVGFSKQGAGILTLTGANIFTGALSIATGTLRATTSAASLGAGTLSLAGGTLELANDTALSFNRNTTVTASSQITVDRLTAGAGVTQTLGTLSLGAQTLSVVAGANVTSGQAGLTFGSVTLTGNGTIASGAGVLNTLGVATTGPITLGANTLTIDGAGDTTFNGSTAGTGGQLVKNGTGTLRILTDPNATGLTTVNGGVLELNHGGTTDGGITIGAAGTLRVLLADKLQDAGTITVNGIYDLRGNEAIGQLLGSGTITTGAASGTFTLTSNSGTTSTYSGVIQNGATAALAFTKNGSSTLTLNGANTYTGTTLVQAGTLLISGDSAVLNGGTTINVGDGSGGGETLTVGAVGDTVAGTLNRLADTAVVTLNGTSTGGLNYNGPAAGSGSTVETIAGLAVSAGRNTVTLTPGTGSEIQLSANTLTRANGGTLLIRGANLGGTGIGSTRLTFANPVLVGGGGADGSTNKSILPFAFGATSATSFGTDLVTVDPTNGVRVLAAGEYDVAIAGDGSLRNVGLTADETVSSSVRINALRITGVDTGATLAAGTTLTLNSGALLFADAPAGANTQSIDGPGTLSFGTAEGAITLATSGATTAALNPGRISGTAGLAIGRSSAVTTGVITLGGDNTIVGTLNINQGTLRLTSATALNNEIPLSVNIRPNAALDLNGNSVNIRNLVVNNGGSSVLNGNSAAATVTSYLTANQNFNGILAAGTGILNAVFSGPFTETFDQGSTATGSFEERNATVVLSGAGGALNAFTSYLLNGGTLRLSSSSGNNLTTRLRDASAITFNAAAFDFDNNAAAGINFSETIGATTLNSGANSITVDKAATGQTSVLTVTSLARTEGATLNLSSQNNGTAIFDLGTTAQSRLVITGATNVNGILGGYATIDSSANTREFVKYVASGTISATALVAADYTTALATGANPTQNVKLTASPVALSGNTQINSLNIQAASATTVDLGGAANTLRLESGGLIVSGTSALNATIQNGRLTAGSGDNSAGDLIIHSLPFARTAVSFVNSSDTVTVGNLVNGTPIVFTGTAPGGLTVGTTYFVVNSTASTFQVATSPGAAVVAITADGATAAFSQSTITSLSAAISDNGTGIVNLVKTGGSILDLQGATNTYTGSTYLNAGFTRISTAAGLGNAATGETLTLSGGATLDINGSLALDPDAGIVVGPGSNIISIASGTAGNGRVVTYTGSITSLGSSEGSLQFRGNPAATSGIDLGDFNATLSALQVNGTFRIDSGTVTVSNATNTIGRGLVVGADGSSTLTYTAAGGSLVVGKGITETLDVGIILNEIAAVPTAVGTLNLAGLANFTANVDQVRVGFNGIGGGTRQTQGVLTLAANNDITANTAVIISSNAGPGQAALASTLTFGSGINNVTTRNFTIGGFKANGVANINAGGTVNLQGFAPNTLNLLIASNQSTGSINVGTFNGTNGTIIASLDQLVVAEKTGGTNGGANGTFTLTGTGNVISANSVRIANLTGNSTTGSLATTGTINFGGGTLVVNNDVSIADFTSNIGTPTTTGRLNVTGGTFTIGGNITRTTDSQTASNSFITVNGGTLDLQNQAGGDTSAGTITASQLAFRAGTIADVGSANLAATSSTNSGVAGTVGDALIMRDTTIGFAVNLTGATAGNVHYEAAGAGVGAVMSGSLDLGTIVRTFNIENSVPAGSDLEVSGAISGVLGGINKIGAGTLTLSGSNNYSGGTTVATGSLIAALDSTLGAANVTVLSTAISLSLGAGVTDAIANTATLSLAGGGTAGMADVGFAILNSGVSESVGGLVLGGIAQTTFGTYGSTLSGATFQDDEYFSGTGVLVLVPEPGTLVTLFGGLGMLAGLQRFRRRKS